MKKAITLLLSLVLLASVLAGCGSNSLLDGSNPLLGGSSAEDETADAADDTPSADSTERYNTYVDLYNELVSGTISRHIDWYFDDIADQAEFESLEGNYPDDSSFSEYDYKDLETAYEYAQSESEYAEVGAAVVTLYPTMKELMEKLDESFEYGAQKGYLDDDFAKAKELHAEIYPLLDTYYAQGNDFIEKFDALAAVENEKELQSLKDEGYELRYTMGKILSVAAKLSEEFNAQETVYSENINELDLTNITPLYEELTALVTDCSAFVKDDSMIENEGFGVTSDIYLGRFADSAVDMKACMAVMIQRVKENDPPTESDMLIPDADDGTFEAFYDIYDGLVDNYNNAI